MNIVNKDSFIKQMTDYGDAVVTYRSPVSKRLKYVVGTTDFSSSPYISNRSTPKYKIKTGAVLLFCWDTDTFKQIDIGAVQRVEPLSKVVSRGVR